MKKFPSHLLNSLFFISVVKEAPLNPIGVVVVESFESYSARELLWKIAHLRELWRQQ